jgi:DNA-binding NarL/FixJ family response regulator
MVARSRLPARISDSTGALVSANDAYHQLLGNGHEEIAPEPGEAIVLTLFFPDGRSAIAELGQLLTAVRDSGEPDDSPSRRAHALTAREREVLGLIAMGASSDGAASALGVGEETVRTHVRNAMAKLGAHTRAQAIALAMRDGLIEV